MSEPARIRSTRDLVEGLRPRVRAYGPDELAAALVQRDDVVVVDLREIQERVLEGAIAGSHHVPRGMLEFWADPAMHYFRSFFEPEREIVLHCAAGDRSVLAAVVLQEMGYPRVAHLHGGFAGWKASGQPVAAVAATSKWIRRP